jgi:hypothetical protein
MGIKLDEAIRQLTTYSIPCGKYKNAYDMAVSTMRKYQKIEGIVKHWVDVDLKESPSIADTNTIEEILEVLEDGNDNN